MNRRSFLKSALMAGAALCLPPIPAQLFESSAKIYTGAKARIFRNRQEVGMIDPNSISFTHVPSGEPIDVLGQFEPTENRTVSVSMKMHKVDEEAVKRLFEG